MLCDARHRQSGKDVLIALLQHVGNLRTRASAERVTA
jgi:hypothetical protein